MWQPATTRTTPQAPSSHPTHHGHSHAEHGHDHAHDHEHEDVELHSNDLDLPIPQFGDLQRSKDYFATVTNDGLGIPQLGAGSAVGDKDWMRQESGLDLDQLNLPVPSVSRSVTGSGVKDCPAWVERHTSFKTRAEPAVVLQRCSAALANQHADFVTNPDKFKVKGVAYVNGSIVHFVVRVYAASSQNDGEFVVEFQKRSGCAMAFNALYRDTIAQITDIYHSNIDGDSALPPLTSLSRAISQAEDSDDESSGKPPQKKPPAHRQTMEEQLAQALADNKLNNDYLSIPGRSRQVSRVPGAEVPIETYKLNAKLEGLAPSEGSSNLCVKELGDSTLCNLLSMAMSDDGCSAREALSALSGLPAKVIVEALTHKTCPDPTHGGNEISMHGMVNALTRALDGSDSQLTRSAAVLLANLSEVPEFSDHLLTNEEDREAVDEATAKFESKGGAHERDHTRLVDQVFTLLNFPTCFSAKCSAVATTQCSFSNRFPALILRDIKRQVAKALSNIALLHPDEMLNLILRAKQLGGKVNYRDVLEKYKLSPCADPRLQNFIESAMSRLNLAR